MLLFEKHSCSNGTVKLFPIRLPACFHGGSADGANGVDAQIEAEEFPGFSLPIVQFSDGDGKHCVVAARSLRASRMHVGRQGVEASIDLRIIHTRLIATDAWNHVNRKGICVCAAPFPKVRFRPGVEVYLDGVLLTRLFALFDDDRLLRNINGRCGRGARHARRRNGQVCFDSHRLCCRADRISQQGSHRYGGRNRFSDRANC